VTARAVVALVAAGLAAMLLAMLLPAGALADGDPASDVLLGQNVFYPFAAPVSSALQAKLNAETAAASRAHFPIKVALIASRSDLGAISSLFGKPGVYAAFLDEEISFSNTRQPLLVVMPDGYGLEGLGSAATAAAASLRAPGGGGGEELAQAAAIAVPKLAAAAGHPIGAVSAGSDVGSGGFSRPLAVLVLAVVAVASAGAIIFVRRWRAGVASAGAMRTRTRTKAHTRPRR
jgi:hypothetical protein